MTTTISEGADAATSAVSKGTQSAAPTAAPTVEVREPQVQNAVRFLQNPKVIGATTQDKVNFLRGKGVTEQEIAAALKRLDPNDPNAESLLSGRKLVDRPTVSPSPLQNSFGAPIPLPTSYAPPPQEGWGSTFIKGGFFASVGAGVSYLATSLFQEQERNEMRQNHAQALQEQEESLANEHQEDRLKKDQDLNKLRRDLEAERAQERREYQDMMRTLREQSRAVQKALDSLNETLRVLRKEKGIDGPRVGLESGISDLLKMHTSGGGGSSETATPKPAWLDTNKPLEPYKSAMDSVAEESLSRPSRHNKSDSDEAAPKSEEDAREELRRAIELMLNDNDETDEDRELLGKCSKLLLMYLNKILKEPKASKYRQMNRFNSMYQSRIVPVSGAEDILYALGFEISTDHGFHMVLPIYDDTKDHEEQIALVNHAKERILELSSNSRSGSQEDQNGPEKVQSLEPAKPTESPAQKDTSSSVLSAMTPPLEPSTPPEPALSPTTVAACEDMAAHPYSTKFQDVVRMMQKGETPPDVRTDIDDTPLEVSEMSGESQSQVQKQWLSGSNVRTQASSEAEAPPMPSWAVPSEDALSQPDDGILTVN